MAQVILRSSILMGDNSTPALPLVPPVPDQGVQVLPKVPDDPHGYQPLPPPRRHRTPMSALGLHTCPRLKCPCYSVLCQLLTTATFCTCPSPAPSVASQACPGRQLGVAGEGGAPRCALYCREKQLCRRPWAPNPLPMSSLLSSRLASSPAQQETHHFSAEQF